MKILVSACLLGHKVRYDGTSKDNYFIKNLEKDHELIAVCPELYGGFDIPHLPIENKNGRVISSDLKDQTDKLIKGTHISLKKYIEEKCDFAILKSKSPSCGKDLIYDGNFNGTLIKGDGFFAKELLKNGIKVFSENDINEIKEYIKKLS